jgi:hypothetical protein
MVGLTIPTTPRQLENDMNVSFRVPLLRAAGRECACAG